LVLALGYLFVFAPVRMEKKCDALSELSTQSQVFEVMGQPSEEVQLSRLSGFGPCDIGLRSLNGEVPDRVFRWSAITEQCFVAFDKEQQFLFSCTMGS